MVGAAVGASVGEPVGAGVGQATPESINSLTAELELPLGVTATADLNSPERTSFYHQFFNFVTLVHGLLSFHS